MHLAISTKVSSNEWDAILISSTVNIYYRPALMSVGVVLLIAMITNYY